ncbi:MAG: geranylgeranylglyceryl/heptaprenylglyceryl phosphate synthase [Ignavibacteriales bacterium]|nr:geranylgeranylglyceryl/heptaprenylglyceryl phosphate synthase [Ignavibacteriales bacterium]
MKVYNYLLETISQKGAAFLILIDPDKVDEGRFPAFLNINNNAGVDGYLIGGSLMMKGDMSRTISIIKSECNKPTIIFPGSVSHVFPEADALLYLSLVSGRNADQLIGKHVISAPIIKRFGIEPISTGYMLIESGGYTAAEYMSASKPIPRTKPEIASATALAAQYIGMKLIYLEAGSGAQLSVPVEMITAVSEICDIPVIVGGGIRDAETAQSKVEAGAKIIVIGNHFEDENNWDMVTEFANAVHCKQKMIVQS